MLGMPLNNAARVVSEVLVIFVKSFGHACSKKLIKFAVTVISPVDPLVDWLSDASGPMTALEIAVPLFVGVLAVCPMVLSIDAVGDAVASM